MILLVPTVNRETRASISILAFIFTAFTAVLDEREISDEMIVARIGSYFLCKGSYFLCAG